MSSPAPETNFDGVAQTFGNYEDTVRGYVRYELTRRNLGDIVSGGELTVADIGGGSSPDTVWLANAGHQVTLVEPSGEQLELASQRITGASQEAQDRITVVQGTTKDILADGGEDSFDLVLSHGVAMYLPHPGRFIDELVELAKPGGFISLLEKGFGGVQSRFSGDDERLDRLLRTHKFTNNMGREAWAFTPADLERMLRHAGAETLKWSGVRIHTDGRRESPASLDPAKLQGLVDQEHKAGHEPRTRGRAQMLHFIAQKHAA